MSLCSSTTLYTIIPIIFSRCLPKATVGHHPYVGAAKKSLSAEERGREQAGAARDAEMANYRIMQRIRDRIDAIVEDPATAESLKPWRG